LEGFGELNFLVATNAARVVGPLRSALEVIFTKVTLRPRHLHCGPLFCEYRRDVGFLPPVVLVVVVLVID
jgi:hypothetical protein